MNLFKSTIIFFAINLLGSNLVSAQDNPIENIQWNPPAWIPDTAKSDKDNLISLLSLLENNAGKYDELSFLESHFASVKMLVEEYSPPMTLIQDLIFAFSDFEGAGGIEEYLAGNRQLLLSYNSRNTNVISYAVYTLPKNWNPLLSYPLYCWGRGGWDTPYPGDIHNQLKQQVKGGFIAGTPSGVYKDGYTIIPGGLGLKSYTGDCRADYLQGLDLFLENFNTDPRCFYMAGFSNGGKATLLISSETMDKYHWAAIGMCAPAANDYLDSERISKIQVPVWLGVGVNDRYGLLSTTRKVKELLTNAGNPPEVYLEVPELDHVWTWDFQKGMYSFLETKEFILAGKAPAAPLNLDLVSVNEDQIVLNWDDNSDNELFFVLERKKEGDDSFVELSKIAPGYTMFSDEELMPDTKYTYRVYAYGASGNSRWSNEFSIKTKSNQELNASGRKSNCK